MKQVISVLAFAILACPSFAQESAETSEPDIDQSAADASNTSKTGDGLLGLAKAHFGFDEDAPVKKLFEKVGKGELADFKSDDGEEVLGKHIAWLLGADASRFVTKNGVRINGARIQGKLDLNYVDVDFPLALENCRISDLQIRDGHVGALYLNGSRLKSGMSAVGLKVDGNIEMDNVRTRSTVNFEAATIGGDFECRNSQFVLKSVNGEQVRDDQYALVLKRAQIDGFIYLNKSDFKAGVNLLLVTIGGTLKCDAAKLGSRQAEYALYLEYAKIRGDVYLSSGFDAHGQVNLFGATIGGQLICTNGSFSDKGFDFSGKDEDRWLHALLMDEAQIAGSVFLRGIRGKFSADGPVRLWHTSIGGNLECSNGLFLKKLDARYAEIEGALRWLNIEKSDETTVDLRFARIGSLEDEEKSWPGVLLLEGLVYGGISSPRDAESRKKWLALQPKNDPSTPISVQPYEQLAEVLRNSGYLYDAEEILMAKEAAIANPVWRWIGQFVGYGYRPARVFWIVVPILFLGCLVFGFGAKKGLVVRSDKDATDDDAHYPKLNALVYSLDTFVPIINLYQAQFWIPSGKKGREWRLLFRLKTGGVLQVYLWIHTILGWGLTTLWVAGLTGIVKS